MEIKITESDFQLIQNVIISESIGFINEASSYLIVGNKESFQSLLDSLAIFLCEKGIKDEGELNYIGNKIERIIDKISTKIY